MQIDFLAAHGFKHDTIGNWRQAGKQELLPLQEEAITRTRLLSGGNVAVFAPTSSGKTFVAELAAIRHFERGRKSIFLVPTKALAEEQFHYLESTYALLGARTVIATRERTLHDSRIARGDFDFAVMVYEKLKAFLTLAPELLSRIAMVSVDELQILGEPGRGDVVDLLLTQIVTAYPKIQVVCLSAVLGENLRLASWLRAEPLIWTERPTELREGVFCLSDSRFYYSESNSAAEAVEALLNDKNAAPAGWSVVADAESFHYPAVEVLCCAFAGRGEQVLIFVPTRDLTRRWAYRLANALSAADTFCEVALADAEESHSLELMQRCLQSGVAFHNADLGGELRRIVEEQFQSGAIRVLVATSTLAQGVNLNCRNVISVPLMLDPLVTAASAKPAFVPLSVQRFRNQGGRAGRLCSGEAYGRSILIAEDEGELRRLMNQYVRAEVESLEPRFTEGVLDRLCLDLIHTGRGTTMDALNTAMMETYCGTTCWAAKPEELHKALDACVLRLKAARLVQQNRKGDRLAATGLGQIAAAFGLQAETIRSFADHCAANGGCSELEVLALCAFSTDGEVFPVAVSHREAAEQHYPRLMKLRYGSLIYALPEALRGHLAPDGGFSNTGMCALKKIFLADAWISVEATHAVEEQFRTFAGTFANLGAHFSWLAQALGACMATLGYATNAVEQVNELAERLAYGTTAAGLPIARLGNGSLTRTHMQQLVRAGFDSIAAIAEISAEELQAIVPLRVAAAVVKEAQRLQVANNRSEAADWFTLLEQWNAAQREKPCAAEGSERAPEPLLAAERGSEYLVQSPELVVDSRNPGEIDFRGQRVKLTPKPFELLCLLAGSPGRTIPYAEIDAALWPDSKVESQQRSAHKTTLVRSLANVCGQEEAEQIVINVARFGIRLNMPHEKIKLGRLRTGVAV
ncbi:MAG: DEAD/DEAH box helicase [Candidatus Sumerlaeaceae bacterium]